MPPPDAQQNRISVLLIEPEIWRATGIVHILAGDAGFDVRSLADVPDLDPLDATQEPAVVLLAYTLVRDDERTAVEAVTRRFPNALILIHGSPVSEAVIADLLCIGAKGYFSLTSRREALAKALRTVVTGALWAPREAFSILAARAAGTPHSRTQEMNSIDAAILTFLRSGRSNKEIALELGCAEVTVKAHLRRMYRRYQVKTRLELLAYSVRAGLFTDRRSA